MTLNQRFGYVFGAVYVLVGLLGFAVTSGVGFASPDGANLIVFEVNPLHNIVHLLVGGLLIGGARAGADPSRSVNMLVGAVYLLVGLLGFLLVGNDSLNILALNGADNGLHLVSAIAALAVGISEQRRSATA